MKTPRFIQLLSERTGSGTWTRLIGLTMDGEVYRWSDGEERWILLANREEKR